MALILSGDTGVPASGISSVNASALPVGSVIQTVSANTNSSVNNASSSYIDTGLTATITPTSATSKILVVVDQNGLYKDSSANAGIAIKLLRNGSQILYMNGRAAGDGPAGQALSIGSASASVLDSPATTSAVTYKTQFSSESNAGTVYCQVYSSGSSITLMEIKQ